MIIKCLILVLSLSIPAWATVPVVRYPSGTPVQVCQPSDSNSNCGSGGSSGNVGIGTAGPGTGGRIAQYIGSGASTTIGSPSNDVIDYNGNMGIGTASPTGAFQVVGGGNVGIAVASPGEPLDVGGTIRSTDFILNKATGANYVLTDTGGNGKASWQAATGGANPGGSATQLQYQVNGTTFGGVAGSSIVGGNIGINSATPGQLLDVIGTVRANNFVKNGGTSSQFLKADGTTDSSAYSTTTGTVTSSGSPVSGNISKFTTATNIAPAAASDIVNLFTTCSGTQYLGADGACHNTSSGANPGGSATNLQYQVNGTTFGGIANSSVDANGNIGLGSASPGQTLDVNGTIRSIVSGNSTFNSNVGVGSLNPGQALDVQGTMRSTGFTLTGNGAASGFMLQSSGTLGIGTWVPAPTGGGSGTVNSGTTGQGAYYASSTTAVSGTSSIFFSGNASGNNIGIGSAVPGQRLDVQGTARFNIPSGQTGVALDVSGTVSQAEFDGAVGIGTTMVNGAQNGGLVIMNGNVGIGTWNPAFMLDVNGTVRIPTSGLTYAGVQVTGVTGTTSNLVLSATSTFTGTTTAAKISSPILRGGTSSTQSYTITSDDAAAGTTDNIQLQLSGPSAVIKVVSIQNNSGNWGVGIGSTSPAGTLDVEGTLRPIILNGLNNANANVGIGSTAPGQVLDVKGTLRITGTGHISSSSAAPTVANNDCGSTAQGTVVAKSTDTAGTVTVGTLTVTSCAVTFANTWQTAPVCIANDDTNVLAIRPSETTNKVTFTSLSSASGDNISWVCIGNE